MAPYGFIKDSETSGKAEHRSPVLHDQLHHLAETWRVIVQTAPVIHHVPYIMWLHDTMLSLLQELSA